MPHAIEIDKITGMAKFASRRVPAWHMLGQVCDQDFMLPSDLAKEAQILGMDVHVEDWSGFNPYKINADTNEQQQVSDGYDFSESFHVTVRTNPATGRREVIEKVGKNYTVIQTEDLVSLADVYSEAYNASAETAGSLRNGRATFISLSLDRDFVLDPQGAADKVKSYLLLTNSFDGSVAFGGLNTPVRVVCQNTLNYAMAGVEQAFTIKHTRTAHDQIEEAKRAAHVNAEYMKRFEMSATRFYETKVTDKKFFEMIEAFYGDEPEDAPAQVVTKWAINVGEVMSLWHGPTIAEVGIGRTAWGALNAFTENDQWLRGIQDGKAESFVRAGAGLRKDVTNDRTRAFDLVADMAGIQF